MFSLRFFLYENISHIISLLETTVWTAMASPQLWLLMTNVGFLKYFQVDFNGVGVGEKVLDLN